MTGHRALAALLAVVATAAAVLSFFALRDLALVCGFDARLAWLLPVVVDAGAAAGSLVSRYNVRCYTITMVFLNRPGFVKTFQSPRPTQLGVPTATVGRYQASSVPPPQAGTGIQIAFVRPRTDDYLSGG